MSIKHTARVLSLATLILGALQCQAALWPAAAETGASRRASTSGPGGDILDVDEDGVPDDVERTLIDRHAPRLFYDHRERHWPSTVLWYVQRSELTFYLPNIGYLTVLNREQMAADPGALLNQHFGNIASSTIGHPAQSAFRLSPREDARAGQGPLPVGTYAHVVPVSGNQLLVQYWQFFPFNDMQYPGDFGDHEGDWLYLDVYVDANAPYHLNMIVYHHHGDGNCAPTILPKDGSLPVDGIPVVYLEEGAHEWWPWARPEPGAGCDYTEAHDGLGPSYRPSGIPNIGERYAPMPGLENEIILLFNGKWGQWFGPVGDPADSPIHQFFPNPPLVVAYVDAQAEAWSDSGLGSHYHPFLALQAAVAAVTVGGGVQIAPGSYPGAYTLSKRMTLRTWGTGSVQIGK
jgi:hypothetical protein